MGCVGEFGSQQDTNGASHKMTSSMNRAIAILIAVFLVPGIGALSRAKTACSFNVY
jgi:hypothetical protein